MSDFGLLVQAIEKGDESETEKLVRSLLQKGKSPQEIIENSIVSALDMVGKKFSSGECFIPEMLIAARASQTALELLRPLLVGTNFQTKGRVIIGTVMGDLHDIGKSIVAMMLQAAGFEIHDLGADVSPEAFVEAAKSFDPQIVALSCLITTTMKAMQTTVGQLREAELTGKVNGVKIIIGGPPISDAYAEKIGADFFGKDAYEGVEIARRIVSA